MASHLIHRSSVCYRQYSFTARRFCYVQNYESYNSNNNMIRINRLQVNDMTSHFYCLATYRVRVMFVKKR